MSGRCKDCRHWLPLSDPWFDMPPHGEWRHCAAIDTYYHASVPPALVYLMPFNQDVLLTSADFGCVLFEPRTETVS